MLYMTFLVKEGSFKKIKINEEIHKIKKCISKKQKYSNQVDIEKKSVQQENRSKRNKA